MQQVSLRANGVAEAGDQLLADGIQGRIGYLGKQLREVVEQHPRLVAEYRNRRVGTHGAECLLPRPSHGQHQQLQLLQCVTKYPLAPQYRLVTPHLMITGGKIIDMQQTGMQPVFIGMIGGQVVLQFFVVDDAALRSVDEEHATGLQAALSDHLVGGDVEHSYLGGHHHHIVRGDPEPTGAQTVAVQYRADHRTVAEGNGCGPVPRLHDGRVVLVKRSALRAHGGVVLPRFGDHHEHRMGQ